MQTESTRPLYRGAQTVWYILGVIEVLLAGRFILRLLQANPNAAFTDLVYTLSYPFRAPFIAVFPNANVAGTVFEWTTLLAMLVYWVLAIGIVKLFFMSRPITIKEADQKLSEKSL